MRSLCLPPGWFILTVLLQALAIELDADGSDGHCSHPEHVDLGSNTTQAECRDQAAAYKKEQNEYNFVSHGGNTTVSTECRLYNTCETLVQHAGQSWRTFEVSDPQRGRYWRRMWFFMRVGALAIGICCLCCCCSCGGYCLWQKFKKPENASDNTGANPVIDLNAEETVPPLTEEQEQCRQRRERRRAAAEAAASSATMASITANAVTTEPVVVGHIQKPQQWQNKQSL